MSTASAIGRIREYQAVQRTLASGWNTWDTQSVLSHVRLPDGLAIRLGIKEYYRGTYLRHAQIGRHGQNVEQVHFGEHAIDGRYTACTVEWQGIVIRVETASCGEDVAILVTPLASQATPAVIVASVSYLWGRPGGVRTTEAGTVIGGAPLRGDTEIRGIGTAVIDPYVDVDGHYISLKLSEPIAFTSGSETTIEEVVHIVSEARTRLLEGALQSSLAEHRAIVNDAVAWNTIYEPSGDRVITTVSRLWNVGKRGGFALFCWDAFFNALLAGEVSRDLAYANVIEMLNEVVPDGFVPNVAQGTGRKSYDGSQPPIAAIVCWELYCRFGDKWFLRQAFPALLSWNRWWWDARRYEGLLCLGSTPFTPEVPSPQEIPRIDQHFGATCESGCDDHPVYSDVVFDTQLHLLRAHDVGLNSEYIADCEALARIADVLGETMAQGELSERARSIRGQMRDRLWDDGSGTFRNHHIETGRPTSFTSAMNFYALFAGVASPAQARTMIQKHLRHAEKFGGDWPVPSTPHDDPRTPVQSYWYGRTWAPVNFLVYIGLLRSGSVEDRAWLSENSRKLIEAEWHSHGHIHENYNSGTGEGCDAPNSEPFYSWGALLSLIVLINEQESGYFTTPFWTVPS